jgi:hypothetical protein
MVSPIALEEVLSIERNMVSPIGRGVEHREKYGCLLLEEVLSTESNMVSLVAQEEEVFTDFRLEEKFNSQELLFVPYNCDNM